MVPPGGRDVTAWAHAALTGELDRIRTAPVGTRNHTLNRSAFVLGQIVAGANLDPDLVHQLLLDAATTAGLHPTEADRTITSGLTAGARHPRTPHDRTRCDPGIELA